MRPHCCVLSIGRLAGAVERVARVRELRGRLLALLAAAILLQERGAGVCCRLRGLRSVLPLIGAGGATSMPVAAALPPAGVCTFFLDSVLARLECFRIGCCSTLWARLPGGCRVACFACSCSISATHQGSGPQTGDLQGCKHQL